MKPAFLMKKLFIKKKTLIPFKTEDNVLQQHRLFFLCLT